MHMSQSRVEELHMSQSRAEELHLHGACTAYFESRPFNEG